MHSVDGGRQRRKKSRCLGAVAVVGREEYVGMAVDTRVELIRALIPLGLMAVQEMLVEEVTALAGPRYARADGAAGLRHGSNPGSVRLAGQRHPLRIPRVRGAQGEIPLRTIDAVSGRGEVDETLLRRVLYGISCRNYAAAADAVPGAIGLSPSSVSRAFVAASAAELKAFQERDLGDETYLALFLDGKTFADTMMVVALGVTESGAKRFLGFVETTTENAAVLTPFLRGLVDRGLSLGAGLLVVIDGSKGLRAAVQKAFAKWALVQRCQWHKRENVVAYLPTGVQALWRTRLQRAYDRPTYAEAKKALLAIHRDLAESNQSAAASLLEGLEETLTLHRLGVAAVLGRSFKTTNCQESVNAAVEERCAKVDAWKTSGQRHRWLAAALRDIEPRLRRVKGYRQLWQLRAALQQDLQLTTSTKDQAAA